MTQANDAPTTSESADVLDLPDRKDAGKPRATPADEAGRLTAAIRNCDRGLVAIVMLLAFLLASFVARNSDFWLHLASGRLIVEGQASFGVDPFAYTTAGTYWVNH